MDNRPTFPSARRMSRRRVLRGAALGLAGLAGAALVGCASDEGGVTVTTSTPTPTGTPEPATTVAAPRFDGTLRLHLAAPPASLDPYAGVAGGGFTSRTIAGHLYSRLLRVAADPDRDPWSTGTAPDLAEGIETQDGRVWTITLRAGVRFHDVPAVSGREVIADDVVASVERLKAVDSPGAALVTHWSQVQAVDDRTVRFTLAAPSAAFPDELADIDRLLVLPREAVEGDIDITSTPVGSGPWVLDEYDPETRFRLRANPALTPEAAPLLPTLEYAFLDDDAALARFRSGDLHGLPLRSDAVLPLRGEQREVQWRGHVSPLLSFLYFSGDDAEAPWRDERFRQAVSLLQDRDALTQAAYNLSAFRDVGLDAPVRWNNLVPAGFTRWWLDPTSGEQGDGARFFVHDPAEARRLLDASGYTGEPIPFLLPAEVYGASFDAVADALVVSAAAVGLNLVPERQDFASEYVARTFRGDFTGMAFGYQSAFTEVGEYFTRMFGAGDTNHGRVGDAVIDDLVERQAIALDEGERRSLIHEIQRRNAEQMYYVPSQAGTGLLWTAYHPQLRGIRQTRGAGGGAEVNPYLSFEA
ncbi:MAG: ABC transporter substrate-binding protein [Dehalococcoidia bacterium]|nr:ABC transporter substrate-binding protein [Dehalococcoidia bacterium]